MSENIKKQEEGIDLMDLFRVIWAGRKRVLLFMGIGALLAIAVVVITPKEYQTQVKLMAETGSKNGAGGLLGQLGNMAGLNLGGLSGLNLGGSSSGDAISPDLYPEIVKSTPFLLDVLAQKVTDSRSGRTMSVADFLSRENRTPLSRIKSWFTGMPAPVALPKKENKTVLELSKEQSDLANGLSDIINLNVTSASSGGLTSEGSKVILVSVELQDPLASAQLADSVVESLKRYIIDYNTGKAKKDLDFIRARFNEARDRYYATQQALAIHSDRNLNVATASAATSKERLQTENQLAQNVYNTMAQVMEQAKIKVQDHTPVFTVIEPARVPLIKSKPRGTVILMGMLFVGAFVGVGTLFLRRG